MRQGQTFIALNANARFGVVALVLGAFGLSATIWIEGAVPMHLLWTAVLVFGQLAYGQEAGFEKPLTKLVLIALLFAVLGFVLFTLEGSAQGGLLFAFGGLLSIFFWAVAMLHCPGPARQMGKAGAVMGGV